MAEFEEIDWEDVRDEVSERVDDPMTPAPYQVVAGTLEDEYDVSGMETGGLIDTAVSRNALKRHDGDLFSFPLNHNKKVPDSNVESPDKPVFEAAVDYFHSLIDNEIKDHTEEGTHPDRPTTAREYFTEVRGFDDQVVEEYRFGWAPPSEHELYRHLASKGYSRSEMLSTGLFYKRDNGGPLPCLWKGKYVLPYLDEDSNPIYAISRSTHKSGGGGAGYEGHPADNQAGKYAQPYLKAEYTDVTEPLFGIHSIDETVNTIVVPEGILDAVRAIENGFPAISPVTTNFARDAYAIVRTLIQENGIDTVVVVPDNDSPNYKEANDIIVDDPTINNYIDYEMVPPGLEGGLTTAMRIQEATEGLDAEIRLAELPRNGLNKIDTDEFIEVYGDGPFRASILSSRPPESYYGYESLKERRKTTTPDEQDTGSPELQSDDNTSALWHLDITDVTGYSEMGERGKNPIKHKGESENYYVVYRGESGDPVGKDFKRGSSSGGVVYNGLTHILVEAGERPIESPGGSLSDREVWAAWKHAKEKGYIAEDDGIPSRALNYIAEKHDLGEPEDDGRLPREVYNKTLRLVEDEYGIDPGRGEISEETDDFSRFYRQRADDVAQHAENIPDSIEIEGWKWETENGEFGGSGLSLIAVIEGVLGSEDAGKGWTDELTDEEFLEVCAIGVDKYDFNPNWQIPYQAYLGFIDKMGEESFRAQLEGDQPRIFVDHNEDKKRLFHHSIQRAEELLRPLLKQDSREDLVEKIDYEK